MIISGQYKTRTADPDCGAGIKRRLGIKRGPGIKHGLKVGVSKTKT